MEKIERIYNWVIKHKKCSILFIIISFISLIFLIQLPYWLGSMYPKYAIKTDLKANDILSFMGSFLSFIGTIALGVLVLIQNNRFKKENDISQKRLENISAELMNLEKDKFRPYLKISTENILIAVSENDFSNVEKIRDYYTKCDLRIEGTVPEKDLEKCLNSVYPLCLVITFEIANIGQSTIANFSLERFKIYDEVTGSIKGFTYFDTSLMSNCKKKVGLSVRLQAQVCEKNGQFMFNNKIYQHYLKTLKEPFRALMIEIAIAYQDIFGRSYKQEYTIHTQYDLLEQLDGAILLKTNDLHVEHHIGESPYEPKIN